jgi:hypothetical protein
VNLQEISRKIPDTLQDLAPRLRVRPSRQITAAYPRE